MLVTFKVFEVMVYLDKYIKHNNLQDDIDWLVQESALTMLMKYVEHYNHKCPLTFL